MISPQLSEANKTMYDSNCAGSAVPYDHDLKPDADFRILFANKHKDP